MRILLCAVIIFCSLLVGIELAKRYKLCCDLLDDMCGLCIHMQSCIRYERTEPELIIQSFRTESVLLNSCKELVSHGLSFHEAWRKTTASNEIAMLCESERLLVREMGEGLGMCDAEGELARLERVYSQLEISRQKRQCELENKRKLCITCGTLAGVFVSIIII